MKTFLTVACVALVALTPVNAAAGNHKSKAAHCPPGLAKKNPPCVPPGQAKKYGYDDYTYRRGDIIEGDYEIIRNPERYGLDRDQTYYRVGDQVVRVNRETREVLDLIGAVSAILN